MKIVAAVFADFAETFLGGRSQLAAGVGSRSILAHTLSRLDRVQGVDARGLVVRSRDADAAGAALREVPLTHAIDVLAIDDGIRPRRRLIRSARKWNLESWRGGPLGTTYFDEFVEDTAVARVLQHYEANGVLCVDGHQPALDPEIATRMIAHQRENVAEAKFVFTPAPPGIAGVVLCREIVAELLEQQWPLGLLLTYRPEFPRADLITRAMCCSIPPAVARVAGRFTGDTRRSRELLKQAFAELGEDCGAVELCGWSQQPGHDRAGPLPVEIEIELTTDDPLPNTTLRPRGAHVSQRVAADRAAIGRMARELGGYDDRLVVLAGHGDPLAHPEFAGICADLRAAGVCGLAVATPLVHLSDENLDAMLTHEVDVLEVLLDANSAETYRAVHGADEFDRVLANMQRIQAARRERHCPHPIVTPSLTRCSATLDDMEAFFDRWIKANGWAVLRGENDFAGQFVRSGETDLRTSRLFSLTPLVREPCRRLSTRLMVLADGCVAQCSQDIHGRNSIGNWRDDELSATWHGSARRSLCESHSHGAAGGLELCQSCSEWSRP